MSDAALIVASADRPELFSGLFARHANTLYRHVSRRIGPEAAEDVVAETFLTAFRKRARYNSAYPDARPWLYGIATRLVARHRRDEITRYRALARTHAEFSAPADDERVVMDLTATAAGSALAAALAGLATGDRDVLLLVAWADLTYEETARALGIPVGTVRSRLNRARRKTRAALGGNPLTDPDEE
ncbi:RNA polymerase sigma-70 factor (ECF subfamily) [Actinocorallia herbida]|uniref:RNA polymerase sigma-70 factor (ECF subfamily) n=1 Tax=Actinocorallia herbida TaxID=58109 RepID=A0A3N1D9K4_9ACTN|nr:RNA polymerase sigma factor [Actinocorallia herbida]ROO90176.1 RNA polymerase sigma-70 factor (ECF subfamily) [Actinocorallia herbida]